MSLRYREGDTYTNMPPAMYVRVKRNKQTIFLHCEPSDTVHVVKEKVAAIVNTPSSDQRLLLGKQNLEDGSTLCDCGVTPADTGTGMRLLRQGFVFVTFSPPFPTELFLVLRVTCENGDEKWEEVNIPKTVCSIEERGGFFNSHSLLGIGKVDEGSSSFLLFYALIITKKKSTQQQSDVPVPQPVAVA